MKNKVLGFSFASLSVIALSSLVAHAADQSFAAVAVCLVESNGAFVTENTGIKNTGASSTNILCSVGQDHAADTNDDVRVYYNETSTTAGMVCGAVEYVSDHSTQTLGDFKWACSTVGGCAAQPANSFTGTGYMNVFDISHGTGWITVISCSTPSNSSVRSLMIDE